MKGSLKQTNKLNLLKTKVNTQLINWISDFVDQLTVSLTTKKILVELEYVFCLYSNYFFCHLSVCTFILYCHELNK